MEMYITPKSLILYFKYAFYVVYLEYTTPLNQVKKINYNIIYTFVFVNFIDHPAQGFDVLGQLFEFLHVLLVLLRCGARRTHYRIGITFRDDYCVIMNAPVVVC